MIRAALFWLLAAAGAWAATDYVSSDIKPLPVQREFRGVWVAAVNNIDWPSKPGLPTEQQKQELLDILDKCQQLRLNVVVFQARPACDAFYESKIEPWSEYLTGAQGRPPSPFWDPLEFAVTQAHARGLELHAWFNPFRARHSSGFSARAREHISRTRPTLVKTYGSHLWLDPGLPEVHDYSARVILDVVRRYDIDGVHIDDYFYPYRETNSAGQIIPFPDWTSWGNYQKAGGKLTRDDWRRDNVNRFVARLYRDVHAAKPWVKVGISPFGIYRPGYPAQIKGFDQYESLYADPKTWLAQGWLDYLAPQLYWRIEPPAQSFPVLLQWWTENNPKHCMIVAGINTAAIGAGNGSGNWPASEIVRQMEIARQQSGASGHIHWNMSALMRNKGGVNEALLRDAYAQPALAPPLNVGSTKPKAPKVTVRNTNKGMEIRCENDGETNIRFFIVQARGGNGIWHTRIATGKSFISEQSPRPEVIAVRAVDRFGNMSEPRTLVRTEAAMPR